MNNTHFDVLLSIYLVFRTKEINFVIFHTESLKTKKYEYTFY